MRGSRSAPGPANPWPVSYSDLEPHYEAVREGDRPDALPAASPGQTRQRRLAFFKAADAAAGSRRDRVARRSR